MKTWIISISAIIILTSIFGLIIPESKIGKLIKSIFSILVVFVMISPLSNIKNQSFSFDDFVNIYSINYQNEFLDYIGEQKVDGLKNECEKIIKNKGVNNVFVDICYKYDVNKKFIIENAIINLKNAVIISDKANINIKEEIKKDISLYLQIDENEIFINE